MAEQENTAVVPGIYESFKAGDIDAMLTGMTEDIEDTQLSGSFPKSPECRSRANGRGMTASENSSRVLLRYLCLWVVPGWHFIRTSAKNPVPCGQGSDKRAV